MHSEKNRRRRSSWQIDSYTCLKRKLLDPKENPESHLGDTFYNAPFTHFPTANPFKGTAMRSQLRLMTAVFHETEVFKDQSWSSHIIWIYMCIIHIYIYSIHRFIYRKTRKWSDSNGSKGFTVFPAVPPNNSLFEAGIRKNRKDFCMESWAGNVRLRRKLMLDELKVPKHLAIWESVGVTI